MNKLLISPKFKKYLNDAFRDCAKINDVEFMKELVAHGADYANKETKGKSITGFICNILYYKSDKILKYICENYIHIFEKIPQDTLIYYIGSYMLDARNTTYMFETIIQYSLITNINDIRLFENIKTSIFQHENSLKANKNKLLTLLKYGFSMTEYFNYMNEHWTNQYHDIYYKKYHELGEERFKIWVEML